MPYIQKPRRVLYDPLIAPLLEKWILEGAVDGDMTYILCKMLWSFMGGHPSYQKIVDVIGILETTKLEFYREIAAPYENKKKDENGGVNENPIKRCRTCKHATFEGETVVGCWEPATYPPCQNHSKWELRPPKKEENGNV